MSPVRLKRGEEPTRGHLNALGAHLERQEPIAGVNVRLTVTPWGTVHHHDADGGGGGFASEIFAPSVRRAGAGVLVSWKQGLIAGVEPSIDGVRISGEPGKRPPALEVREFNEDGEALCYFRLRWSEAWVLKSVEAVALLEVPPLVGFEAHKLALIVFRKGGYWRALHSNLQHLALNPTGRGFAQHLFTADL